MVTEDPLPGATRFSDLTATTASGPPAHVDGDTIVKFLFTSGSTGMPKGVINTQRMWCSNQAMIAACLPFLTEEPPVLVDWTPWNHTFGGNHDVGLTIYNGGTLYIDDGRPIPGAFEESVRNLREIATTFFLNVPRGFECLVPYLRADKKLREVFFSRLKLMWYAGASLSQPVWDELDALSIETTGERVLMLTGLGSTETAPFALAPRKEVERAGMVGIPAPGMELKLVPNEGKLEARVRGPNITPGYWAQEDLTRDAFDEEGFYKLGDALLFVDEDKPELGFTFDGRLAEDFKLSSGTWVSVGPLRAKFIHQAAPYAKDVVVAGHDRDDVAVLIIPDMEACREHGSHKQIPRILGGSSAPKHRQFQPHHPRDRSHRAFIDGRPRNHGQRLHQPAIGPDQPRRAGGRSLRIPTTPARHCAVIVGRDVSCRLHYSPNIRQATRTMASPRPKGWSPSQAPPAKSPSAHRWAARSAGSPAVFRANHKLPIRQTAPLTIMV